MDIDITITGLMGIDIAANQLTLKLDLITTWTDSRLNFFNLKVAVVDSMQGCPLGVDSPKGVSLGVGCPPGIYSLQDVPQELIPNMVFPKS